LVGCPLVSGNRTADGSMTRAVRPIAMDGVKAGNAGAISCPATILFSVSTWRPVGCDLPHTRESNRDNARFDDSRRP